MTKKTVLVTGATSGIGKSVAYLFAKHQYNLILTGRRKDRLQLIADTLCAQYQIHVQSLCFDVRNHEEVKAAIESIDSLQFPTIDILINNAGLAAGMSTIQEGNIDDWDTMLDTNVKGLLYVSKAIMPRMISQGYGHIINIGSTAAKDVYANGNVYCASKQAVDALTKSMRIDLLPYHIKVTGIHPGAAETEFSLVRFKGDEARAKSVYNGFTPLSPDDIAEVIFYTTQLPPHVCINDVVLTSTHQANAIYIHKKQS